MRNRVQLWPVACHLLALAGAPAAAQTPLWLDQFGTTADDETAALASDGSGGVFMLGHTNGSLAAPLQWPWDIWLARYNSAGSRLWILQFGTSEGEYAFALAPDGVGGVFLAGQTGYCGGADPWLARYDAAGARAWFIQFGTCIVDAPFALAPDGAGGFFVGGGVNGSLGGPFAGGNSDVWLARYNGAGTRIWITQFGTSATTIPLWEACRALAPDGAGGVFATGTTPGSLGGPNAGGLDVWLARYDAAGNRTWLRQFGTSSGDWGFALVPDEQGGVYVGGSFGNNAMLARYDGAGNQIWVREPWTFGEILGLAQDAAGGVYVTDHSHLARFDGTGTPMWISQPWGGLGFGEDLAQDDAGGVYVAGWAQGSLGGPHAGSHDAWIGRYADACYPDCNADTQLTVADFGCFQTRFVAADPYADCNGDGQRTVADFGCFQTKFVAGCP